MSAAAAVVAGRSSRGPTRACWRTSRARPRPWARTRPSSARSTSLATSFCLKLFLSTSLNCMPRRASLSRTERLRITLSLRAASVAAPISREMIAWLSRAELVPDVRVEQRPVARPDVLGQRDVLLDLVELLLLDQQQRVLLGVDDVRLQRGVELARARSGSARRPATGTCRRGSCPARRGSSGRPGRRRCGSAWSRW